MICAINLTALTIWDTPSLAVQFLPGLELPDAMAGILSWVVLAMAAILWLLLIFIPISIRGHLAQQNRHHEQEREQMSHLIKAVEYTATQNKSLAEGLFVLNQQLEKQILSSRRS